MLALVSFSSSSSGQSASRFPRFRPTTGSHQISRQKAQRKEYNLYDDLDVQVACKVQCRCACHRRLPPESLRFGRPCLWKGQRWATSDVGSSCLFSVKYSGLSTLTKLQNPVQKVGRHLCQYLPIDLVLSFVHIPYCRSQTMTSSRRRVQVVERGIALIDFVNVDSVVQVWGDSSVFPVFLCKLPSRHINRLQGEGSFRTRKKCCQRWNGGRTT